MAKLLNVYKGEEVVQSVKAEKDGSAKATISGLYAGTEYPKGTFQVSFSNESGESDKVDVPAFTTEQAEQPEESGYTEQPEESEDTSESGFTRQPEDTEDTEDTTESGYTRQSEDTEEPEA